jgi:secreted PhoX family phosphatase
MDYSKTDPMDQTYSKVYLNGEPQWVKVKPGREKAAAFLETHRYAAIRGGSMGFSKMEGTTLNTTDRVLYSALSACRDSMIAEDSKHDPKSMVNLPKALKAGAVMELKLSKDTLDNNKNTIDSDWVPISLQAILNGEDLPNPDELGNTANPDKIANPDNLKFDEKMRTLFIGEDSSMHMNNFLWAYHVDTKTLSRILSCPAGAESTGLQSCNSVHGWTYITSNFQHAGDWRSVHKKVQPTLDSMIRANYDNRYSAAVGYLTSSPVQTKIER